MKPMLLTLAFATLSSLAVGADYDFKVVDDLGQVTIKIDKPAHEFRMCAWLPGDYELFHYGKFISEVQFFRKGVEVTATHDDADVDGWKIEGGADEVRYKVRQSRGNFSPNLAIRDTHVFINGGGVFGYFPGFTDGPQKLTLPAKAETAIRDGDSYVARSYDELLDSPIVYGSSVKTSSETFGGKVHTVVAFNRSENYDQAGFLKLGLAAAKQCQQLFGELPYRKYMWFYDCGGGGGGLEHSEGARLGVGPNSRPEQSCSYVFHEFFHTFNVKRIRAKVLGPFDYSKPAVNGSIWWLEGVTDYFADILCARAGYYTTAQALSAVNGSVQQCATPSYLKVSADECSRKVWDVRGSFGFGGVSYYTKGTAIGLLLDLAIRGETGGAKCLDDVIRQLYVETKRPKPGFEDERLRELCVEVGGPALGPVYDQAVLKTGPLPWDSVLAKAGFKLQNGSVTVDESATGKARAIAAHWPLPTGN